jgi:hypothetical protein
MLKKLIELLRKLPVAKYLRPLWKGALKEGVDLGKDYLKRELAKVEDKAPAKLKAVINNWSQLLQARVRALPLPEGIENKMCGAINAEAAELCARVDAAGESDAVLQMVNPAIEQAANILKARIEAL